MTGGLLLLALPLTLLAGCPDPAPPVAPDAGAVAPDTAPPAPWPDAGARWGALTSSRWDKVKALVTRPPSETNEETALQALDLTSAGIAKARAAGNSADWTQGLVWLQSIENTRLVNNTEEALDAVRKSPWPDDLRGRAAVTFFYVLKLTEYAYQHSRVIARHDDKVKRSPDEIETWSQPMLRAEALARLAPLWRHRAELAGHKESALDGVVPLDAYLHAPRATLRDTASYLLARVLAQTEWWTAKERAAVEGLDPTRPHARVIAARAGAHPLARLAAVLDDLARWHEAHGRGEAALAAWLHKLEQTHALQRSPEARERLRAALAARVKQLRGKPGHARAAATLIALSLAAKRPDRAAALRLARACQRGAREGPPAAACKHFEQQLTKPELALATTPGRPALVLTTRNLPAVYLRAYPVTRHQLTTGQAGASQLTVEKIEKLIGRSAPVASWKVTPAPSPALAPRRTPVKPPLTGPGTYLVLASARKGFPYKDNVTQGAVLVLSDLVLVQQREPDRVTVTAISAASGAPVPGVEIRCHRRFWRTPTVVAARATTDADGRARFDRLARDRFHFFSARKGRDWTLEAEVPFLRDPYHRGELLLVLPDRQRYRPGQTLRYKLFALQVPGAGREPTPLAGKRLTLELEDVEGLTIGSTSLTTNAQGTFTGEHKLPAYLPGAALTFEAPFHGAALKFEVPLQRPAERDAALPAPPRKATGGLTLGLKTPIALTGEVVEVVVGSDRAAQPVFLSLYNRGALLEHRRLSVARGPARLKLPITAAHQGGLGLVAWTVRGGRLRSATATLAVPRAGKRLELKIAPRSPRLQPGKPSHVTLTALRAGTSTPAPGAELMLILARGDDTSCHRPLFGPGHLLDRLGLEQAPRASRGAFGAFNVRAAGFTRPAPVPPRLRHLSTLAGIKPSVFGPTYTYGTAPRYGLGMSPKSPFSGPIVRPSLQRTVRAQWRDSVRAASCGAAEPAVVTHLVTDARGAARVALKAPTAGSWRLRALATTADLAAGAITTPVVVAR